MDGLYTINLTIIDSEILESIYCSRSGVVESIGQPVVDPLSVAEVNQTLKGFFDIR